MRRGIGERVAAAPSRFAVLALGSSLLAFAVPAGLQKIRSYDYWWHLRSGQFIWEAGAVPRFDPFTFTMAGERWIDIHWLYQLGLYGVYSLGGHGAVIMAKLLLIIALLAVVGSVGYRRERPLVTGVALALMLLVSCGRFMPRPELLSYLLLAAVLALLDRFVRRGDAWVYAIVPIQLVWVNVQGLFALGIAVCTIYLVSEVARPLVSGGSLDVARVKRLAILTALAALVSLVNPNFVDGPLFSLTQFGMIERSQGGEVLGSVIAEFRSPLDPRRQISALDIGLGISLAALSLGALLLNHRRARESDLLLWLAFFYLALSATRNRAIFAIVAAVVLVRNASDLLDAHPVRAPRMLRGAGVALLSLVLIGLGADVVRDRFFQRFGSLREFGLGVMDFELPVAAVQWIDRERPPGPICHDMADGGYLMWRLYPRYPVMSDGRLEMFGAKRLLELQCSTLEGFRRLDGAYRFGVALVHYSLVYDQELLHWLYLNSNWQLVFVDETAAVFVRVPRGERPRFSELDVDDPALFPPLPEESGSRDQARRRARTQFYMAIRRWRRALEIWEEAIARYPDAVNGRFLHADLLQRNGMLARAEEIFRALLAEDPEDGLLHKRMGDIRLALGDREAARGFFDDALSLRPDLLGAALQRGRIAEADGDVDLAIRMYRWVLSASREDDPLAAEAEGRIEALGGRAMGF